MKKYFFDIPVYRLSYEDYKNEVNKSIKGNYYYFFINKDGTKKNELITFESHYAKSIKYHDIWDYNEIIGYIKLYILGTQVRGKYYQHKSTRIRKTRTKSFIFKTHKLTPEINIHNKTNSEIYILILDYLENCKLELKKRFIDIDNFRNIGQYVDWNKLIEEDINKNL